MEGEREEERKKKRTEGKKSRWLGKHLLNNIQTRVMSITSKLPRLFLPLPN